MKLQAKLLLVLVPLIVAPLLALGWIAYTQLRDTSTEKTLREMTTLLDQLGRNVEVMLDTARANLDLFSNSAQLQNYLLTPDEAERYGLLQPALVKLLAGYQQAYPSYYDIRILLPDGYEDTRVTSAHIPDVTEQETITPYFRALQRSRDEVYSTFFRNPYDRRIALLIAKRLRIKDLAADPLQAEPILRGYLAVTVDLSFMERQVTENQPGGAGWIFFTDGKGQILFHPQPDQVGVALPAGLFSRLRESGKTAALVVTRYQQQATFFQSRQLGPNLFLIGSLPERGLLAASKDISNMVGVITLITILFTTSLMFVVLKYLLVGPIQKLSRATRELGHGTIPRLVNIKTRDEIGELAHSFNEMAGNLRRSNAQVSYLAYHDNLTGLPNRLMLKEQLGRAMAHAQRTQRSLALLFLDLDNFKPVNDTLGHHAGDLLLKEVAERLWTCLRKADFVLPGGFANAPEPAQAPDMVARLGGDEFLVLLTDLNQSRDAEGIATRILEALAKPLYVGRNELFVSASIGITVFPGDGQDIDTLIKNADVAMYHAKDHGRNNFQYYSESMNAAAVKRLAMDTKLRKALENERLLLYYQPQIDVATGRIVGCEALCRWRDPELGWVPPASFIPLAEETGLIIPISEWVLREACRQNKAWQTAGFGDLFISVNVSGIHANRTNLGEIIAKALRETGLEPRFLDVELTETCVMTTRDRGPRVLDQLRALGVGISLDDFGTGYSSLSHLQRLSLDKLKIDRSFLKNVPFDEDNAAIVSAIIAIAHRLELAVTAEGVETEHQLQFLKAEGCDLVQGFMFSRPVSAQALEELLTINGRSPAGPGAVWTDLPEWQRFRLRPGVESPPLDPRQG